MKQTERKAYVAPAVTVVTFVPEKVICTSLNPSDGKETDTKKPQTGGDAWNGGMSNHRGSGSSIWDN